jgi:hypothetical protein
MADTKVDGSPDTTSDMVDEQSAAQLVGQARSEGLNDRRGADC